MKNIADSEHQIDPNAFWSLQGSLRHLDEDQTITISPSAAPSLPPDVGGGVIRSPSASRAKDTTIVVETLKVYGTTYLVFFLLFCFLRRKYPKLYNLRGWVPELECELAKTIEYPGWFSWAWKVRKVDDVELLKNIGMDGLCFIRCLRLGAKLSFGGVLNSVWLIPMFLTADTEYPDSYVTDKFAKISVVHLTSGSPRMAGVVVAAYILLFYTLKMLSKELDWYTGFRHKYLSQEMPRNYTVYVSGIPEELRSNFALGDYFRSWSSESAVVEAHMAMDTPKLDSYVARRKTVIKKLEHAIAKERMLGFKAQHRTFSFRNLCRRGRNVSEKVDSVEAYRKELHKLNYRISLGIGKLANRNHRMRQFLSKEETRRSGKLLSVPALSPLSEQEDDVLFRPEASAGDEDLNFLFANQCDEELGETKSENSSNYAAILSPGDIGDLYRIRATPLQLDEAPKTNSMDSVTQPSQELGQRTSTDSINVKDETNPTAATAVGELGNVSSSDANLSVESFSVASNSTSGSQLQCSTSNKSTRRIFSDRVCHGASAGVTVGIRGLSGGVKQFKKATGAGLHVATKVADKGFSTAMKAAEKGVSTLHHAPELAFKLKESAAFIAPALAGAEDGGPRNAGFVVFSSLFTCHAARQMLQHGKANTMVVEPAPPPDEIFWPNVGLPDNAKKTGRLLSIAATVTLCLFWSIPVAFLSSLTTVSSLKQELPTLGKWVDAAPWLELFLGLIAPLLLLIMNEVVLRNVLRYFSKWEGLVGGPQLEASTFVKMSTFVIIQTFFVSAISGSITSQIANILETPQDIVVLLGNSLATRASYFIQIILVFTFMVQGMALLRVVPLTQALIRRFIGPRLTAKERRKSWKFVRSLEDPIFFFHAEVTAQLALFFVVFFVYAPIAPVTCVFLWPCFLICESGYRYNFIHNYKRTRDSGGRIFKGFTRVMLASILIGQLTLLGTMGLKQALYALPALAPLLIITVLYATFVYPKKIEVAESLPTIMTVELDRQREAEGANLEFLKGQYVQPSLKHKFLYADENVE